MLHSLRSNNTTNFRPAARAYSQRYHLLLNSTDSYNQLSKKICKTNILEWAGLRRSIPLSLRSYDRYPSINSPTFVVGTIDVTKGKSKNYYNLLIREKAKPPNIIQKLQSNFNFNSDNLKQIFKLPHSIAVESYVKALSLIHI